MSSMSKPDQPSAFERQSGRRTPPGRKPEPSRFEAVWEGDSEMLASVIAGSLETDGIRAVILGSRPIPHSGLTVLGSGMWSVSVPSSKADQARDLLRESGEEGGVVSSSTGLGGNQLMTLRFAVFGLVAPLVAIAAFLIARAFASN